MSNSYNELQGKNSLREGPNTGVKSQEFQRIAILGDVKNHADKAMNTSCMRNEGLLFEHNTKLDVPQVAHPNEIVLQFCDSELWGCPFPQPAWRHPGFPARIFFPSWATRFKVQLIHTERTPLFSTTTSHCSLLTKQLFLQI